MKGLNNMVELSYCGGIPEISKTANYKVAAGPEWFEIKIGFGKVLKIPYESIADVAIKTGEQLANSATPLDFLFAGRMAFAIKKKEVTNYLVIDYDCGGGIKTSAIFKGVNVPVVHSVMLKQRVEFAKNNPQPEPAPVTDPPADVAADIQKFFDLKEKGIISEEEYNAKKVQLLGL